MLFLATISSFKIWGYIINGLRKKNQEKGLEMDSEMSSCSCFLLRQLLLVQKTAHARGAVRELRAMVIGPRLRNRGGALLF